MKFSRCNAWLVLASLGAGCAVGPTYEPPIANAGDGWSLGEVEQTGPAELDAWWRRFDDSTLDALIERARQNNLDVRMASARIAEARALRAVAGSAAYPVVNVGGTVTWLQFSKNGSLPVGRIPGFDDRQTVYDPGFDAVWELDIFGGNRRRSEAAGARLEVTQAQAADVQLAVTAEVARAYLELRGAQQELAAVRALVAANEATAELVALGEQAGEFSRVNLAQARGLAAASRAQLAPLESRVRGLVAGLGVLTGTLPESELALLDLPAAPVVALSPLPVGQRADILARRADVRAAERRLAAATADAGVAHAARFPRLSIGANGGFQALNAGDLTSSDSVRWAIGPGLSWRLFDGGRVRAEVEASEARVEQAMLAYEKAVLNALGDAEQALARYRYSLEALEQQRSAVSFATSSLKFAELRHQAGDAPLLDQLTAHRQLAEASGRLATVQTQASVALVGLVKSLGGGWEDQKQ